jgi:hypothetical protein
MTFPVNDRPFADVTEIRNLENLRESISGVLRMFPSDSADNGQKIPSSCGDAEMHLSILKDNCAGRAMI